MYAGRQSPEYDGPAELDYCTDVKIYSNTSVITGIAQFKKREMIEEGLGGPGAPEPIRYAEIMVTNSEGEIVQCGETDETGNFNLNLPLDTNTYTIVIYSRAHNSHVRVSIFDAPEKNQLYSLSTSVVTADPNISVGTLTAEANGENLLGAAFNIYDLILKANEYLRDQLGNCSTKVKDCTNFTVAPKLSVYWEKGFNPNSYFNQSSGVSFYLPSKKRLFILGGIDGDTDYQDTDHFDAAIILHEYGHFLEDTFSITNSPGGPHSGNSIIDPRLALGEGWGNFFQAAVLYEISETEPRYIDTSGNIDGSTDLIFSINLEKPDSICSAFPGTPGCDIPERENEGNFREFSITRFLWDTVDTVVDESPNDVEDVSDRFVEIWSSLASEDGYKNSNVDFRSIGFFHNIQSKLVSADNSPISDWTRLRESRQHQHRGDRREYALYLSKSGDCTKTDDTNGFFQMNPKGNYEDDIIAEEPVSSGDLLANNDFFQINHTEEKDFNLTMTYTTETSSGASKADLDLYLYNTSGRWGYIEDLVDKSDTSPDKPEDLSVSETETITIEDLPPGTYLINVNVFLENPTDPPGATSFSLSTKTGTKQDGTPLNVTLCPQEL